MTYVKTELAPDWTIPYGSEFWRKAVANPLEPGEIGLGEVMDRVGHAFRRDESRTQDPRVDGKTYSIRATPSGPKFSPFLPGKLQAQRAQKETTTSTDSMDRGFLETLGANPQPDPRTELSVVTKGVWVGGARLDEGLLEWAAVGNTVQGRRDPHGNIIEHYEAKREGVEVSWILKKRPIGVGPLRVEAEVSGLTHLASDDKNHHFADSRGRPRVSIGRATLVDAQGARTPLQSNVRDGVLSISVPQTLLASAAYPLAIDPIIASEFGLGAILEGSEGDQTEPDLAGGGTTGLAIWRDSGRIIAARLRADPIHVLSEDQLGVDVSSEGSDARVACDTTRCLVVYSVTAPAEAVKGIWFDLTDASVSTVTLGTGGSHRKPAVASNGSKFLVAWETAPDGSGYVEMRGTRITSGASTTEDGTAGIVLNTSSAEYSTPAVDSDGTDFVVAWLKTTLPYQVVARRVRGAGTALQDPVNVAREYTNSAQSVGPPLALSYSAEASRYLATFAFKPSSNNPHCRSQRIEPDGAPVGNATRSLPTTSDSRWCDTVGQPSGSNHDWMIAFESLDNGGDIASSLYAGALQTSGADASGVLVESDSEGAQLRPAIARVGDSYVIVWDSPGAGRDIESVTVDDFGNPSNQTVLSIEPATMPAFGDQVRPEVAAAAGNGFAVWEDTRGGGSAIYGSRLTNGSAAPQDKPSTLIAESGAKPDVACSALKCLVVWEAYENAYNIQGAFVDPITGTLSETGIFSIGLQSDDQREPRAASNGTDFLVTWREEVGTSAAIYSSRVDGLIEVALDGVGLKVNSVSGISFQSHDVTSDGENYLAVYERASTDDIYSRSIDASTGQPGSTESLIMVGDWANPRLAHNGSTTAAEYLVVAEDHSGANVAVQCRRLNSAGQALASTISIIANTSMDSPRPTIASFAGTGDWLVITPDRTSAPGYLRGRKVAGGSGTVTTFFDEESGSSESPSASLVGADFALFYAEPGEGWDIHSRMVTASSGVVGTASSFAVQLDYNTSSIGAEGYQYRPALAVSGETVIAVWEDQSSDPTEIFAARIDKNGASLDPLGVPLEQQGSEPAIACTDTRCLVVYEGTGTPSIVRAVEMSSSLGIPVGSAFDVNSQSVEMRYPEIAELDDRYLVVWEEEDAGDVDVAVLHLDANSLLPVFGGSAKRKLDDQSTDQSRPRVASRTTTFEVVWQDERSGNANIHHKSVSVAGLPSGSSTQLTTNSDPDLQPDVAAYYGSDGVLVSWTRELPSSGGVHAIYSRRLVGGVETQIEIATGHQQFLESAVSGFDDGSGNDVWVLLGTDVSSSTVKRVFSSEINASGTEVSTRTLAGDFAYSYTEHPAVVAEASRVYGAWVQDAGRDIHGGELAADGSLVSSATLVSTGSNRQGRPSTACNDSTCLVAWEDNSPNGRSIRGARIIPPDNVLDPQGIELVTSTYDVVSPSIGTNGSDFVLCYYVLSSSGLFGIRRVAFSGSLGTEQYPDSHPSNSSISSCSIASDGTDYFIAYAEAGYSKTMFTILDPTDTYTTPTQLEATGGVANKGPKASYDGNVYNVVIGQNESWQPKLRHYRISTAGVIQSPTSGSLVGGSSTNSQHGVIASNSTESFVVWADVAAGSLKGAHVDSSGTLGSEIVIDSAGGYFPSIAASGADQYAVVWQALGTGSAGYDLKLGRIADSGTAWILEEVDELASADYDEVEPSVAEFGTDNYLVAYSRYVRQPPESGMRIRARIVGLTDDVDFDNDGFGAAVDCDDNDVAFNPSALESCDLVDNDCDGSLVDGFLDNDDDGIPDCADLDNDNDCKCDDGQTRATGAGIDTGSGANCPNASVCTNSCSGGCSGTENCNFHWDDAGATVNCPSPTDDIDGDGIADEDESLLARTDPNTGPPGAPELCDGRDNDRDGEIDEGTGCEVCQ